MAAGAVVNGLIGKEKRTTRSKAQSCSVVDPRLQDSRRRPPGIQWVQYTQMTSQPTPKPARRTPNLGTLYILGGLPARPGSNIQDKLRAASSLARGFGPAQGLLAKAIQCQISLSLSRSLSLLRACERASEPPILSSLTYSAVCGGAYLFCLFGSSQLSGRALLGFGSGAGGCQNC